MNSQERVGTLIDDFFTMCINVEKVIFFWLHFCRKGKELKIFSSTPKKSFHDCFLLPSSNPSVPNFESSQQLIILKTVNTFSSWFWIKVSHKYSEIDFLSQIDRKHFSLTGLHIFTSFFINNWLTLSFLQINEPFEVKWKPQNVTNQRLHSLIDLWFDCAVDLLLLIINKLTRARMGDQLNFYFDLKDFK